MTHRPTETPLFTLEGGLFDDVETIPTTPVDELDLPREVYTGPETPDLSEISLALIEELDPESNAGR